LKEQLTRSPKALPELKIANKPVDELSFGDFELTGYDPDPLIRFEVAV
jgi:thymidylate synthase